MEEYRNRMEHNMQRRVAVYRSAPLVEVRPRCPTCNSKQRRTNRTQPLGDGSILRWCECLDCGEKYKTLERGN